jgi:preprotein translocase subunit YajC
MLENLQKGDKIVTNGGLILEIVKVEDAFFTAKSVDDTKLRVSRSFVASKWEDQPQEG